jgi:hypothetical protein
MQERDELRALKRDKYVKRKKSKEIMCTEKKKRKERKRKRRRKWKKEEW